jgi:hypothetical protein
MEKKHDGAFITQSPYKLIKDGKFKSVPWILGVNSEEGLLHAGGVKLAFDINRTVKMMSSFSF